MSGNDRPSAPTGAKSGLWLVLAPSADVSVDSLQGPLSHLAGAAITQQLALPRGDASPACLPAGDPLFEAVVDGLTFDLCGRDCDPAQIRAQGEPRDVAEALRPFTGRRAIVITPGPHLAAAAGTMPVVRSMMQLGAAIAAVVPRIDRIVWPPSGWRVEPAQFGTAIAQWRGGGAWPTPGLVRFQRSIDGNIQSAGLAHFTGQELRLEGLSNADPDYIERLAARLAEMLVYHGRLVEAEQFVGPSGEQLHLAPSVNGRYVRAQPG